MKSPWTILMANSVARDWMMGGFMRAVPTKDKNSEVLAAKADSPVHANGYGWHGFHHTY